MFTRSRRTNGNEWTEWELGNFPKKIKYVGQLICTFYSHSLSQVHKRTTDEQVLGRRTSPELFYCFKERESKRELSLRALRSRFRRFYYYSMFSCFHSYSHFNQHDVLLLSLPSPSSSPLCVRTRCFTTFSLLRAPLQPTDELFISKFFFD